MSNIPLRKICSDPTVNRTLRGPSSYVNEESSISRSDTITMRNNSQSPKVILNT